MRRLLLLVLVLATCWADNPILDPILNDVPPQLTQAVSGDYRLPEDIKPLKYIIKLTPTFKDTDNSSSFHFEGESSITLEVLKETNQIVFNSKNLVIKEVNLTPKNVSIKSVSHNETTELTTILLNQTINANTTGLKLTLTYNGTLNDNLRGFYRSSYKKGNETR